MERPVDWAEKYRPKKLDDLIGNRNIIATFKGFILTSNIPKFMILWGEPGRGKSAGAVAFARDYYIHKGILDEEGRQIVGLFPPLKIMRGAVTIEQVKTEIFDFMRNYPPRFDVVNIIIFDEADGISRPALLELRPNIERWAGITHVIFTTNADPSIWLDHFDLMLKALRDRALIYEFTSPTMDDIILRLRYIMAQEGFTLPDEDLRDIVKKSGTSVRKSVELLQEAHARAVVERRIPVVPPPRPLVAEAPPLPPKKPIVRPEAKFKVGDRAMYKGEPSRIIEVRYNEDLRRWEYRFG